MRIYEQREKTIKQSHLVSCTCDLCGRQAASADWDAACFQENETNVEVKIRQREGSSYPEGGSGTEYRVDLCPRCFKERLIPWLISQGANIKEEDWCW